MNKQHDRGWASLEFGGALLLTLVIVAYGASVWRDYIENRNWQIESKMASTYASASQAYIGRNYTALQASGSTTTPTIITTAMLKNTGFLPSGFADTNSAGQTMQTYVIQNSQNTKLLQAMIVSYGGTNFSDKALIHISTGIKTGFGGYVQDSKNAIGALQAWTIPLSKYGAKSGNGHIAVLLSTDDLSAAAQDTDRLYRFEVTGHPDLNKMHTSVDMGGNNVNNAGAVNAQTGNFSSNVSAGGNVTATGEVKGANVTANKDLVAGGTLVLKEVNVAGRACYPNGRISRDSTGGVLSCQSGAWVSPGKPAKMVIVYGPTACYRQSSIATCPAGMTISSGGWSLVQYNGGNNAPDSSFPLNSTQWVTSSNGDNICIMSIAQCE
ncbi:shufflon system plasmid conjugative transfer pilus tip adhesin PilV [Salmonella enterica subsp. enterica]|nr:shufflon system plasmid conjugative transfer pilus tip adhesin PilV [Salmonella enterica subsp. enterica]MIF52469.1 shufflon system plasmid conjugative transfer pilus tip adhesin PilV [Salmonella enterica subsp. enterica]